MNLDVEKLVGVALFIKKNSVSSSNYALIFIPIFTISLWLIKADYLGLGESVVNKIKICEIQSIMDHGTMSISPDNGFMVIFEPTKGDYSIPVKSSNSKIWTSLSYDSLNTNKSRLLFEAQNLRIKTPFYGIDESVVLIVRGDSHRTVFIPGETHTFSEFKILNKKTYWLPIGCFVVCLFSFGVTFGFF